MPNAVRNILEDRCASLVLFVVCLVSLNAASSSVAAAPRNILLINTDNQNWFDLGCYGNKIKQTPNMDQLANEGVRFRQAFATAAATDITRTLLDWGGFNDPAKGTHGRSFLPILDTPHPEGWNAALLSHVAHEIYSYYPMRILRERRYKLIWNMTWKAQLPVPVDTFNRRLWRSIAESKATYIGPRTVESYLNRPKFELYDLDNDPWELKSLAADPSHAERLKLMTASLQQRLEETEDPWLKKYQPNW